MPWIEFSVISCKLEKHENFIKSYFQDDIIQPVRNALDYYTNMQNVTDGENKKDKTEDNGGKNGLRHSSKKGNTVP